MKPPAPLDTPETTSTPARGAVGLLLGTRENVSHCVASSGSKAVGLLGVGTPISPSALGLGDEALSIGTGVLGSFLTMSKMSRSSRSPLSSRG